MMIPLDQAPVRKTVIVHASVEDAFAVFTDEIDAWWPRTHHIGTTPMRRIVMEGRLDGRCFTEHTDGSEREWGRVIAWDPPRRFVLAWQITHEWGSQPDLSRCSEVEVRFLSHVGRATRVELEHRHFDRHGSGGEAMRGVVDASNGWTRVLGLFTDHFIPITRPTR
jgi:hypothetical protein